MESTENLPLNLVAHTGSTPVCAATLFAENPAPHPLVKSVPDADPQGADGNRQKSSEIPATARRLSREELRHLITVLNGEIGRTGLDQEHGRRSAALKGKLLAIHAHGFEHA